MALKRRRGDRSRPHGRLGSLSDTRRREARCTRTTAARFRKFPEALGGRGTAARSRAAPLGEHPLEEDRRRAQLNTPALRTERPPSCCAERTTTTAVIIDANRLPLARPCRATFAYYSRRCHAAAAGAVRDGCDRATNLPSAHDDDELHRAVVLVHRAHAPTHSCITHMSYRAHAALIGAPVGARFSVRWTPTWRWCGFSFMAFAPR